MATPKVDKDLCISCGLCTQICSEVFEMNEDDIAQVRTDADLDSDCIQDAIDQCPVSAITI